MHHLPKAVPALLRPKNRYSYCDTSDNHYQTSAINHQQLNFLLMRSNSADLPLKEPRVIGEMERSKLSVTPSSPIQSPRYSLLTGETSSENSSAVNTPQHEIDPVLMTSSMPSGGYIHSDHNKYHQHQRTCPHSLVEPAEIEEDVYNLNANGVCCRQSLTLKDKLCSNVSCIRVVYCHLHLLVL